MKFKILMFMLVPGIVACNNSSKFNKTVDLSSITTNLTPNSVAKATVTDNAGATDIACNGFIILNPIAAVKQPTGWSCWAAALTMMYEAKDNAAYTIDQVLQRAGGNYERIFSDDKGISRSDKDRLVAATGLKAKAPQNFTIDGWCNLLRDKGALWVTTDELPQALKVAIHARILFGIKGDGTPANTTMLFIDPATGTENSEKFTDFIVKYESELKKTFKKLEGKDFPEGSPIRIQVIHW